jgi:uncharacterized peroxidase-related enzyme
MSVRIPRVDFEQASPEQREALSKVKSAVGKVPGLYATFAQAPNVLTALLQFQGALRVGELTVRDRDLIDLHVSQLNGCGYCVAAHTAIGKANKLSDEQLLRFRDGQGETDRDAAVLALSRRVVHGHGLGAGAEIAQARAAGLSDAAIVEVVAAAALRSLVNAVALVSGAEIDWPKAPRTPEA